MKLAACFKLLVSFPVLRKARRCILVTKLEVPSDERAHYRLRISFGHRVELEKTLPRPSRAVDNWNESEN